MIVKVLIGKRPDEDGKKFIGEYIIMSEEPIGEIIAVVNTIHPISNIECLELTVDVCNIKWNIASISIGMAKA